MCDKWLIVGISGTTCGGKTTLANYLHKRFPNESRVLSQDDYYYDVNDPKLEDIPHLNHKNFDSLSSIDMSKMFNNINSIVDNHRMITSNKVNSKSILDTNILVKTIQQKLTKEKIAILIIEGFCIFNYRPVADLCNLKYYLALGKEECFKRRKSRRYIPADVPGYFEQYVWPQHLQQKAEVQENVANVTWFDENTKNPLDIILSDIFNII